MGKKSWMVDTGEFPMVHANPRKKRKNMSAIYHKELQYLTIVTET